MTVEALRRGEPAVLEELLARYGQEIQGVAYLILRDRADAEDVLADTLLRALDRGTSLRDAASLRPWLLRMATNLALSHRRRTARVATISVIPDVAAAAVDATDRMALLEGLAMLSRQGRAVIVLHYYADLTVADVAAALGTSPNTVKTQLRRALERLRRSMAEGTPAAAEPEVVHG